MKRHYITCVTRLFFLKVLLLTTLLTCLFPIITSSGVTAATIGAPQDNVWERTLVAARKEGKVTIFATSSGAVRIALGNGFKKRYGIDTEWIAGRGVEFSQKIATERRAGLYLEDALLSGADTLTTTLKPAGVLDPLEPLLIIPEVRDPKVWWKGTLPFIDKDGYVAAVLCYVQSRVYINTDMVQADELKSYHDLLNSKWKGRILMGDPTIPGASLAWVQAIGLRTMGVDFLRKLLGQNPTIFRDERLLSEWLARGKNPILIGVKADPIAEFEKAGAHVKEIETSEGGFLTTGPGNIAILNRAPHPNAAKVFLNWILSKEGQLIYSKANLAQSARVDVSTDHLDPLRLRVPGRKYVIRDSEEVLLGTKNDLIIVKEIFGNSVKSAK